MPRTELVGERQRFAGGSRAQQRRNQVSRRQHRIASPGHRGAQQRQGIAGPVEVV
jgi:hypothetical protein